MNKGNKKIGWGEGERLGSHGLVGAQNRPCLHPPPRDFLLVADASLLWDFCHFQLSTNSNQEDIIEFEDCVVTHDLRDGFSNSGMQDVIISRFPQSSDYISLKMIKN